MTRLPIVVALMATAGSVLADPLSGPVPNPTLEFRVQGTNPNNGNQFNWSNTSAGSPTTIQFAVDPQTGDIDLAQSYSLRSSANIAGSSTPLFQIDVVPEGGSSALLPESLRSQLALQTGGNLDPFLTYGYAVVNNTNFTQTYTATYTSPIVPGVTLPNFVRATISGGLVDGNGNGVTLGLAPGAGTTQTFSLSNDGGLTFVNAGVDVGSPETEFGASGSFLYGLYGTPTVAGPLGSWTHMRLETRFTLTGGGDVAAIGGYAEILPIPEPSEIAFMLSGHALAGVIARRRRERTPASA